MRLNSQAQAVIDELHTVLGHSQPFFAPIAAVAALAVNVGERGQRVIGMLVGVVVAWVSLSLLGTSLLEVALVIAVAMLVTRALVSGIIGLIQSGASAAIVIATQSTAPASERLLDTMIGGGVALLVSQVLFPPSPLSILANAGREVLAPISEGLRASALTNNNDAAAASAALSRLREGRGSLDDLAKARETSGRVSRRTLQGRRDKSRQLDDLDARLGDSRPPLRERPTPRARHAPAPRTGERCGAGVVEPRGRGARQRGRGAGREPRWPQRQAPGARIGARGGASRCFRHGYSLRARRGADPPGRLRCPADGHARGAQTGEVNGTEGYRQASHGRSYT